VIEQYLLEDRCNISLLRCSIQCGSDDEDEEATEYYENTDYLDDIGNGLWALLAFEGTCAAVSRLTVRA